MRNVFFQDLSIETFLKYEPENGLFPFVFSSQYDLQCPFQTVVMKQRWNQSSLLSPYFHKHLHLFSLSTQKLQALSMQTPTELMVKQQHLQL